MNLLTLVKQLMSLCIIIIFFFFGVTTNGIQAQNHFNVPTETDYTHFNFALNTTTQLQTTHQERMTSSDEYWFQTNGLALREGVKVNLTQPDALIRIIQGPTVTGSNPVQTLDTSLFNFHSDNHFPKPEIKQVISQSQLMSSDLFKNSIAIKTTENNLAREFKLQTSQALSASDIYMINVKEKNSPYQLQLNLHSQIFSDNNQFGAFSLLHNKNVSLIPKQLEVNLVSPNGNSTPVKYTLNSQGKININLETPEQLISPINGLYEVYVTASGTHNGIRVKRNAKMAIAFKKDTAKISNVILSTDTAKATLDISVKTKSRFEVRGILYAKNKQGLMVPAIEAHAAQTLRTGEQNIQLPFNTKILSQLQLTAPYELREIRLIDQKQLALINVFNREVTVNE